MNLEQRAEERIGKEVPSGRQADVIETLTSYAGPERDRVVWGILELSKGDLEKVRHFVRAAQRDYRDVLYWAEYYESDPMLEGRDSKKMVDDILAKWGDRRSDV